jgi:hypothetical protein
VFYAVQVGGIVASERRTRRAGATS